MNYTLAYHADVKEDVANIPVNIRSRIRNAIEKRLSENPILAGQPLRQSLKGHRKLRIGDYRVIYRVESSHIIILKIGHRRDVYKNVFNRLK